MATGYASPSKWRHLSVAPDNLRNDILTLIENEISNIHHKKSELEEDIKNERIAISELHLDQSLKRMGVEFFDLFYSHRFDPNTPLEETVDALESIYKSGKALYIGISSYSSKKTLQIYKILKSKKINLFIHQPSYSLINRWIEKDLI